MKEFFNPPPVFIEINPTSLRILRESGGLELQLQRAADGKLTAACRKGLMAALQNFLGRKHWQPRVRAVCGISAHGVSLRKIALPALTGGEIESVLRLQIEKEFPLSPDDLAWGWREMSNGPAGRETIVAAVRKEVIADYAGLLSEAGANPEFTVSAFARELACPSRNEAHAILEMDRSHAELVFIENGAATSLKILPSDGDIADAVLKFSPAKIIYISGNAATQNGLFEKLSARLDCRRLEIPGGDGFSAATLGLKKSVSENIPMPRLQSKLQPAKTAFSFSQMDFSRAENRRWLARIGVLLILLLILPYAEAILFKPLLARKLAAFKVQRQQFVSVVGPELHFLQSFKQSEPPYLDAIYLFSKAAAPGTHLDSLTLNQHGEITLKAAMQSAQQVMDFRTKLIESGFFANITVEEQTPIQNQPRVNVRMTAQWKPAGSRAAVKAVLSPVSAGKTNSPDAPAMPAMPDKIPKS
ncbi:MAG TPA: hypothetical protein VIK35_12710 [Verrucomicrobiae bacterium]